MFYRTLASKKNWLLSIILVASLAMAHFFWLRYRDMLGRSLVDDLLNDNPCAVPCWQEITPGETSRDQALIMLQKNSYIRPDSQREGGTAEQGGVMWEWRVSGRRLPPSIKWREGVVQEIALGLTHDMTVEQVIGKFGPPEAIVALDGGIPEHWYWIVDLYYPTHGLQLQAFSSEYSTLLEPSTHVDVVRFYVPTSLQQRVYDQYGQDDAAEESISASVLRSMRPWRGYGDLFDVYYDSPHDLEMR